MLILEYQKPWFTRDNSLQPWTNETKLRPDFKSLGEKAAAFLGCDLAYSQYEGLPGVCLEKWPFAVWLRQTHLNYSIVEQRQKLKDPETGKILLAVSHRVSFSQEPDGTVTQCRVDIPDGDSNGKVIGGDWEDYGRRVHKQLPTTPHKDFVWLLKKLGFRGNVWSDAQRDKMGMAQAVNHSMSPYDPAIVVVHKDGTATIDVKGLKPGGYYLDGNLREAIE